MLPFPYQSACAHNPARLPDTPFIVAAFYTPDDPYRDYAQRLMRSCATFGLWCAVYQVPGVHRSVSLRSTYDDPALTKQNFILHLLDTYQKPVLYLDVDCVFETEPSVIFELARAGRHDLAIYNWFADRTNEAYIPVAASLPDGRGGRVAADQRFYAYRGGITQYSTEQMLCGGCTQFYANTANARAFLRACHDLTAQWHDRASDHVIDYNYNTLIFKQKTLNLRTYWLDKAYARYPFWIFSNPIIRHTDVPHPEFSTRVPESTVGKRFFAEYLQQYPANPKIPPGTWLDVEQKRLVRKEGRNLVTVAPWTEAFWL